MSDETTFEVVTKASVAELIEHKFFQCETRLRDHMMDMILPYVKKQQVIVEHHERLVEAQERVDIKLDTLDIHHKLMIAIQKRLEETSKTQAELASKVTELFEMTQDLNKQQRNRVDSVNVEIS